VASSITLNNYKILLFDSSSSSSKTPLYSHLASGQVQDVAISAYGEYFCAGSGDNFVYLFDNEIIPSPFSLTSTADQPDDDGTFNLIWTSSQPSKSYSVYFSYHPIITINSSVYLVKEGITGLSHSIINYPEGLYYFIVEAKNDYGKRLSNSINVSVSYPTSSLDDEVEPGDDEKTDIETSLLNLFTTFVNSILIIAGVVGATFFTLGLLFGRRKKSSEPKMTKKSKESSRSQDKSPKSKTKKR